MGTHPIFESDFDCLTDGKVATVDQSIEIVEKAPVKAALQPPKCQWSRLSRFRQATAIRVAARSDLRAQRRSDEKRKRLLGEIHGEQGRQQRTRRNRCSNVKFFNPTIYFCKKISKKNFFISQKKKKKKKKK